ncbi:hypothetical protein G7Y89_g11990 [Cudoniella acicularis]|uniref:N-acetyltransferase domain-containing protein n=1 Tax=Cudoniella acicularis TaxID=354080 RepID=A0A8H4VXG8_9HELO|nr:hypothetical protein G7Y89_g11990 [Cudoniella acicularis]
MGEGKFIGLVAFRREFLMILDEEERVKVKGTNDALEAGGAGIQWEIGFHPSPTCRGRDIIPAAVRPLINVFLVPHMNVHIMTAALFEENIASRKVLEKCGFLFEELVADAIELPESKTGVEEKNVGIGRMRWDRNAAIV